MADGRDHDPALAATDVAFEMEDLLPGPQNQLPAGDGHCQGRSEEGGLQVGVAVAIVPGLFVAVIAAGRDQLIQNGRHIRAQTWLEFDRTDDSGASHIEHVNNTRSGA